MEENSIDNPDFGTVNIDNVRYKTMLTKTYLMRKPYEPINFKLVVSFIPGTIVKVYVKVGDKVKKGDKLIVLEAMKMNNELMASMDAVIKSVNVSAGERVVRNQPLIEFK
ncbi:MAG: acetyl-CoA carboxylase biotin carboxyl carrier protein subunit [Bacteroidota bacterium]